MPRGHNTDHTDADLDQGPLNYNGHAHGLSQTMLPDTPNSPPTIHSVDYPNTYVHMSDSICLQFSSNYPD